jgi:Icc-related predicted phosphoesterase
MKMKFTRILYGSDFHGSENVFRKFISAAFQYQANVLIVGGDVTGKAMVPIVNQGGGCYRGYLFGRKEESDTPEGLERLQKTIRNVGFYPIMLEQDEAEELENDSVKMGARFEQEMKNRVREWMDLAEEKLAPQKIHMYFMPGNDDLYSIDEIIDQYQHVHNPDCRRFMIDDEHELVGLSNANMTPWHCARDLEEDELSKRLDYVASLIQDPARAITVLHVPPFNSGLDTCPELDKNLKMITEGGQVVMKSAGSPSVTEFIERVQPLLALHGHIHESAGHKKIGRTLAINAGSEYAEGILKAAIINIEGDKVKGHLLISG